MQQATTRAQDPSNEAPSSTVGENVAAELAELRANLARLANDARIKSRSASAEVQETFEALEGEMKRFAVQVENATSKSRQDVEELGATLQRRFQKLLNQIAVRAK